MIMKISPVLLMCGLSMVCIVGYNRYHRCDPAPVRYEISTDSLFAPFVQTDLSEYVASLGACKVADLIVLVKKQFPVVDTLNLRYCSDGGIHLAVKAQKPFMLVDEKMVATIQGTFHPRIFFDESVLAPLPTIFVEGGVEQCTDSAAFTTFIRECAAPLCNRYTITWKDKHTVVLVDSNNKECSIFCRADMPIADALLANIQQLFDQIKGTIPGKKQWIADARFEHQIILYEDKKGA